MQEGGISAGWGAKGRKARRKESRNKSGKERERKGRNESSLVGGGENTQNFFQGYFVEEVYNIDSDVFTHYVINFGTKSQFRGLPLTHVGMFNPLFLHSITFYFYHLQYQISYMEHGRCSTKTNNVQFLPFMVE